MDTRITPFGDHPDGGKISELKEGEEIPDYTMPLGEEARKILENIPQNQRMNHVLNSGDPRLEKEREWLINKLEKENKLAFIHKHSQQTLRAEK